jgi:hypothetical protein
VLVGRADLAVDDVGVAELRAGEEGVLGIDERLV